MPKADIRRLIRSLRRRAALCQEETSSVCSLINRLAIDFENFDWPTGPAIIKDADCQPPSVPRKRIKVGPVLFEDRPICMLMMPVNDVTLAVGGRHRLDRFSISRFQRPAHQADSLHRRPRVRKRGVYRYTSA